MRVKMSLLFALMFLGHVFAQEINVKNIIGEAYIEKDVSPNQAREKALSNAKLNALKKAGIGEEINAYTSLYRSETNGDFAKFFNSEIQSHTKGGIANYSIISERIYCKNEIEIVCEIIIDATVLKYKSSSDPKFQVNVSGLQPFYVENDEFKLNLTSTKDSYLTIFDIFENTASLIYPLDTKSQQIMQHIDYSFPFDNQIFNVSLNNVKNKAENHRLIFVFTKEYYPLINVSKDFTLEDDDLMKWIYSIEPENRMHVISPFIIHAKP